MRLFSMCRSSTCPSIGCDKDSIDGIGDGHHVSATTIDLRECNDGWDGDYCDSTPLLESVETVDTITPRGLCPDIASNNRRSSKTAEFACVVPGMSPIGTPLSMVPGKRVRYSKQVVSRRKPRGSAPLIPGDLSSQAAGKKKSGGTSSGPNYLFEKNALFVVRDRNVDPVSPFSHKCSKVPQLPYTTQDPWGGCDETIEWPDDFTPMKDGEQMAKGIQGCIDALKHAMERSELHLMRENGDLVPATLVLSDDCSLLTLRYVRGDDGVPKQERVPAKPGSRANSDNVFRWNRDARTLIHSGDVVDLFTEGMLPDILWESDDKPLSHHHALPDNDEHDRLAVDDIGSAHDKSKSGVAQRDSGDVGEEIDDLGSADDGVKRRRWDLAVRLVNHVFVGKQEDAWKQDHAFVTSTPADEKCVTLVLAHGECITFSFPTLTARNHFAKCIRIIRASIE
eukprot:GEMP01023842.1.p1 GENE.GEMP01023842.1~~GEMP01023842.1.p1  ORF type:complete len:452 (+),score=101.19 GEMP01023842.1:118-1473(+)